MDISSKITASASRGSFSVLVKVTSPGLLVPGKAQQPVDGLSLHPAAQLAHALGGPACGGRQHHIHSHPAEHLHDAPYGGGLAGARAAGEQHHALLGGQLHRLALEGGVDDVLLGLDAVDELFRLPAPVRLGGEQKEQLSAA